MRQNGWARSFLTRQEEAARKVCTAPTWVGGQAVGGCGWVPWGCAVGRCERGAGL